MHGRAFIGGIRTSDWAGLLDQVDWRAASITIFVQIGLFTALLWSITTTPPPKAVIGNAGISVFALANAREPAPTVSVPVDALIVPPPIVRVKLASVIANVKPSPSPPSPILSLSGQACDVASFVRAALTNSPDSLSTLVAIDAASPPISRANMLWDGAWVLPAFERDAASFSIVQQSVVQAIATAPPECQAEPMTGPQFIMLDGVNAGRTIILVMGSGSWSWNQLLPSVDATSEQIDGIWSSRSEGRAANNQPTA